MPDIIGTPRNVRLVNEDGTATLRFETYLEANTTVTNNISTETEIITTETTESSSTGLIFRLQQKVKDLELQLLNSPSGQFSKLQKQIDELRVLVN